MLCKLFKSANNGQKEMDKSNTSIWIRKKTMMLASNIPLKSKEDLIKTVRCYIDIDRWKIEEYFKFKKQEYNFEDFRVRTLKSINN